MFLIMRKLITFLQLICLFATLIHLGLLLYIYIFIYQNPFWYLTIYSTIIQENIFEYSFSIGLFSFIISMVLFLIYMKRYMLRFYLLIAPTIIWTIYFIFFTSILIQRLLCQRKLTADKHSDTDKQRITGGNSTYNKLAGKWLNEAFLTMVIVES